MPTSAAHGTFIVLRWQNGTAAAEGRTELTLGTPGVSDRWVHWRWDGERFTLDCDRFGLVPVYFAQHGHALIVALEIEEILQQGVPPDLDHDALGVFLRLGSFLSDATPFRAIRALPAGAHLEWRDGAAIVSSRLDWPKRDRTVTREAALDAYIHRFRKAVETRLARHDRIILPLSAGLDSTHILLEMHRLGAAPECCVTVDNPFADNTEDVYGAADIASRFGYRHIVLDRPPPLIASHDWVFASMAMRVIAHHWARPLVDFLESQGPVSVFDGLAGDNLSASVFVTRRAVSLIERGDFQELAVRFFARGPQEEYWRQVLAPEVYDAMPFERARDAVANALVGALDAANPIGRFMFLNRTRTLIGPLSAVAFPPNAEPLYPYLDHDVFELLASLPVQYMLDKSFHSDALARAFGDWRPQPRLKRRAVRTRMRFLSHWREVALALARGAQDFQRVSRRPYYAANPLRWLREDHPSGVVHQMLYLDRLLRRAESGPRPE